MHRLKIPIRFANDNDLFDGEGSPDAWVDEVCEILEGLDKMLEQLEKQLLAEEETR